MDWDVEYYQKENGEVPVAEFLSSLPPKHRAKAFSELELLQKHGLYLREPYVKSLQGQTYKGIFELRVKFASDISRIFYFCYRNNTFVLLHGFVKKSSQTPKRDLDRALRYRADYEKRCGNEHK